jgi:hypothetical protein
VTRPLARYVRHLSWRPCSGNLPSFDRVRIGRNGRIAAVQPNY